MHSPLFREGLSRGRLTLLTLAGTLMLYWGYSRVVTPRVQPPSVQGAPSVSQFDGNPTPITNLEWAKEHLPHAEWAGDARYQMRTDENTFVYAETAERVDSDQAVRFKPFALIWNQKGRKKDEPPITVVCDSAYVQFANKFDAAKPNPGRVIAGALEGKVEIRGANDLRILGRDFRFTETSMSMWSDQPLRFVYAKHHGKAIGVQCELLGHPGGPNAQPERFAVAGFRKIRLRRDVAMHFLFEGSKDKKLLGLDKAPKSRPADPADKKKPPVRVRVLSRGSFAFDLETNVATFEDDVRVYRPTKPGKFDFLNCHRLTLQFEKSETTAATDKKPSPKKQKGPERFKTIDAKLTFSRLHAEPARPNGRVTLISEASNLTATMEDLVYSAKTKVAELSDRNWVRVNQSTSETLAKRIKLVQDKKGSVTTLICEGAGSIKHIDKKTGRVDLTATWKKRLRKFPDPKSDLDIIELHEDAVLHQPKEQSTLRAGLIKIWIDRRKKKETSKSPKDSSESRDRMRGRKLHRMLALNGVRMSSPQLDAHTKQLQVWFQHPRSPGSSKIPEISSARLRLSTPSSRAVAFASVSDDLSKSEDDRSLLFKRSKDDGPMEVWGDLIQALIFQGRNKNETYVREIKTKGNVRVRQVHKDGDDPLRLSGNLLHIVAGKARNDQTLHVYGKPAKVQDRGMLMEGSNIHLDRVRNRAWIDGRGTLQLPIKRSLDGERLATPQTLEIWWKKQMTFDGLTARFRGSVRSVVEDSRVRCEEMDVKMNTRISFADKKRRGKQKPDVKTVVCNLGVRFISYEFDEQKRNRLVQMRKGGVKKFTIDQATGDTKAIGPGWMAFWRRGESGGRRFGRLAKVQANRANKTADKKSEWNYSRIDFSGNAVGNIKQRYNTFHDHVKVVYGPVERPPHVIDLDSDDVPEGVGSMTSKKLVVTQEPKTKDRPAFITMTANGNAEVDGRGFHARADTITYNEWQDLYTLRSVGQWKATIWRQTDLGGKLSRVDSQRMQFIPSKNWLSFDKTKTLDGLR